MIFLNKSQRGVNLERGGVCERERERERERDPPVIHTKYSENFFFLEINIVKTSFVVCCI